MKPIISKFVPQIIRMLLQRITTTRRKARPFPHTITLTNFITDGCKFEVTSRGEKGRVLGLGGEESFIRLFLAQVQREDVVFDIGSCVGLYALHAALCGASVIAFEPDPSFRERLIKNITINKLQNSIQVMEWAVADRRGTATLYTDGLDGLSPSLSLVGDRGVILVRTDSIDSAIAKRILPMPTLLKIDIEGAEILALRGMTKLLGSENLPHYIFIELHPDFLPGFNSSVDECVSLIESFGYVIEHSTARAQQTHYIYRKG